MFLAPQVALHGTLAPLENGTAGVMQTLAVMRQLVRRYRTDMDVRRAATNVLFLTPERNGLHRASAIFEWVRDHIRYVPDVLDVETLHTPDRVLASRIGDCDDQSTLLAAMFESVGYPTRFVVEGYRDPGQFEHVFVQVQVDGQWLTADPTEQHALGWEPPGAVVSYTERV